MEVGFEQIDTFEPREKNKMSRTTIRLPSDASIFPGKDMKVVFEIDGSAALHLCKNGYLEKG